jgi:CPA2 family monovalent cation:H+ antiporter-2
MRLALVGVWMRRVIRVVQDQRDARYNFCCAVVGADDDTVNELGRGKAGNSNFALGIRSVSRSTGSLCTLAGCVRHQFAQERRQSHIGK